MNGIAVHAMLSAGSPPDGRTAVVLVHGLGLSHRYMMPTAEALVRRFRVFVPDLPGFGDSGHPKRILDIPGLADALGAWMAAVGLRRAALLGNSQGCQIILDLAARHPERVACGILQGPTTPRGERTWLWQFIRWRQNGRYNPPELDPVTWGEYRKSGYWRVLGTFRKSLLDRPEKKAPRVHAPMLVVRGQCDPICREGWAEELARLLPKGSLTLIPGVGHTLVFTAPDELAAVAALFIER